MGYTTSDTFGSLIDEVITSLQGFGTDNDQVCTLTSTLNASATTFTVDDSDGISRGLVEIDEEILYVASAENGSVVIQPWGRGYKGTSPVSHAINTAVSVAPTWPRAVVAREVNNTIRAVYPNLFAVTTHDFTTAGITWQYSVPANIDRVLAVEWSWITTAIDGWMPVTGWELVQSANTTDFATGKALLLSEPLPSGCRIHVTYAKPPSFLVNTSDLYSSTGLPASSRDVVVYGAAARLLPWQDTGRVPVSSVSSDAQDSLKPVGNGVALAKELRSMYASRLADERRILQERYPSRSHRVR